MQDIVKIHQNDNVAVALRPIAAGETLQVGGAAVTTTEEIPQGHKFALRPIQAGRRSSSTAFASALPRRIFLPAAGCTCTM